MPDLYDSYQCTWQWQASSNVLASHILPATFSPRSILPFPTKKMRNPQQEEVMTDNVNHTSVHTHLERAHGMQPLEFIKVAVHLLCATAAVLVMSLQYHLFRDRPTKQAIFVVSSIIVLIRLIFLASRLF